MPSPGSRLLLIAVAACLFISCATGNQITPKSEWSALKQAKVTRCQDWPMRENNLEIRDIKVTRVGGISFVVSAVLRTGEPIHYLMPFDGSTSLDRGSQKILLFGKKGVPLGASTVNGIPVAWLGQSDVDGNGYIELRSLMDNVVVSKSKVPGHLIQEGEAIPEGNGSWILYKGATVLDDGSYESAGDGYAMLGWSQMTASGLSFRPFEAAKFRGPPKVATRSDRALALWPQTNKRDSQFHVKEFNERGSTVMSSTISLKVRDLEGYSLAAMPNEYLLGYIEGDSLVGNASLQIARFITSESGESRILTTKRFPLANQHVSDPVWVAGNGEATLLVLTWVDEESTLATVQVTAGDIQDPVLSGIFPKGTRIGAAFFDPKSADLYALMRHRDGATWHWQICKVDRG